MGFYVIVALTVLNHIAYKGSKMLISLYAIDLGATPLTIGILYSLYSFFSLFLALYAGRISDRLGARVPMLVGSLALGCGLLVPWLWHGLPALFVSATLIGTLYIFYHVSAQHLIGAFGLGPAFWMDALLLGGGAYLMKAELQQRARAARGRGMTRQKNFPYVRYRTDKSRQRRIIRHGSRHSFPP